jgi:phage shock protein C
MRKLSRIKGNGSMLGGVLSGLADYLEVDVTLLRVLTVAGFFSPAPVVFIYLIMWAIMPLKERYVLAS